MIANRSLWMDWIICRIVTHLITGHPIQVVASGKGGIYFFHTFPCFLSLAKVSTKEVQKVNSPFPYSWFLVYENEIDSTACWFGSRRLCNISLPQKNRSSLLSSAPSLIIRAHGGSPRYWAQIPEMATKESEGRLRNAPKSRAEGSSAAG